jgi:hypothetical protein
MSKTVYEAPGGVSIEDGILGGSDALVHFRIQDRLLDSSEKSLGVKGFDR